MSRHDVIIIGGGLSGASALHRLAREGANVILLERRTSLGGVARSRRNAQGALVESGPNSAQSGTPELAALVEDLHLADKIVRPGEAAANRYIMRDGALVVAPTTPREFLRTALFNRRTRLRALRERFVAPAPADREESVAQFVERRLGRDVLEYAVDPFISGIYAGRPEHLSLRHAFPGLHSLEQTHGSLIRGALRMQRQRSKERRRAAKEGRSATAPERGIFSFTEGMGMLPQTIQEYWHDLLRLGCAVERMERQGSLWSVQAGGDTYTARDLIVATEADTAASLLAPIQPELGDVLRTIEHPPLAVATMLYGRSAVEHPLDGFGLLIPSSEHRRILGVIFSSTLFPGRAPEGTVLLTAFTGGARDPHRTAVSDEELLYEVHGELRRILGIGSKPLSSDLQRWPRSIPQYNLGYQRVLDAIAAAEECLPGLHLLGSYRGGVSVGDRVKAGWQLAERLLASGIIPPVTANSNRPECGTENIAEME
ncbi:MAG TPA: protoporphyrinogen oxidase [Candidatus Kapabacteria bacterium]|nr:protoporphyrinogen oxidase [Candidatus Kapabacteria bacterium]